MRHRILGVLMLSGLALAGCQSSNSGNLTPTGTGQTPSSGAVPAQTPS